jgi:FkbM family methyltransferase
MDDGFDARALPDAKVMEVPWYFRLGRFLAKHHIRGGNRIVSAARRRGLLNRLALYPVGKIELRVPLWRPSNEWDADDVLRYDAPFITALAAAIERLPSRVTVIDCGADIGTVSALLVACCSNVSRVIAFEPSPGAYDVLRKNLAGMPVHGTARYAAAGSDSGRCELVHDADDQSAHAMYIVPRENGTIEVEPIDSLGIATDRPCVIKIGVEGSEASVIAGAMLTIRRASAVVVAFRAHPRITRRTGEDPVQIMRALRAIRADMTFTIDSAPDRRISLDIPLFEQLPADRVYNVVGCSLR